MDIKYNIHKVTDKIYAVVVKNNFDRAMLFIRCSEFYESKKYKGKHIKIWDFIREYSNGGDFKYPTDWEAYNLPISIAESCTTFAIQQRGRDNYTPYDTIMYRIIYNLPLDGYLIGVESLRGRNYFHELCHALYFTNKEYKKEADKITLGLDKGVYKKLKKELLSLGYNKSVVNDEIQAYFTTEDTPIIAKCIGEFESYDLHRLYKKSLLKYLKP